LGVKQSSDNHLRKCIELGSPWVLRLTPRVSDHYTMLTVVGNPGSYGVVRKAMNIHTKELVAIKCINKMRYKSRESQQSYFSDLRSEVYLMHLASEHPHIVKICSAYEDIQNLYLVLSYCRGGELYDVVTENRESLTEQIAADVFRQMVSSIYYLHSLGIAHCDLKPENFVFADEERKQLMLIDFGMAKIIEFRKYFDTVVGSPYYVAPEVLRNNYNESCDIWSLGVCLFVMIFGYAPFFDASHSPKAVYKKIIRGFDPKVKPGYGAWFPEKQRVSSQCRDLIARMMRTNAADRMTAEEILEHPWLKMGTDPIVAEQKESDEVDEPEYRRTISQNLVRISNPAVLNALRFYKYDQTVLHSKVLDLLQECNYLNTNQMDSLKDFLSAADTNGDGQISPDELHHALKRIDPDVTLQDAKSIVVAIDADHNGYISFDEILSARINRKLKSKESRLRKVFQSFDYNGDGKITAMELEAAWESVFQESTESLDFKEIIEEIDKDGDGAINYEEFIAAFCKSRRGSMEKEKVEREQEKLRAIVN